MVNGGWVAASPNKTGELDPCSCKEKATRKRESKESLKCHDDCMFEIQKPLWSHLSFPPSSLTYHRNRKPSVVRFNIVANLLFASVVIRKTALI